MILLKLLNNILIKKENFSNEEDTDVAKNTYVYINDYNPSASYDDLTVGDKISIISIYIIFFLISFYSAYLSLSCTWNGRVTNIFIRFLFALFAFNLGPIYLIWYFIVNYLFGACKNG